MHMGLTKPYKHCKSQGKLPVKVLLTLTPNKHAQLTIVVHMCVFRWLKDTSISAFRQM